MLFFAPDPDYDKTGHLYKKDIKQMTIEAPHIYRNQTWKGQSRILL